MSKTTSTLPANVIPLTLYNNHHFTNVYFADDNFYILLPDGKYRITPWHYTKRNRSYNTLIRDDNGIQRTINKNVFYQTYWFG